MNKPKTIVVSGSFRKHFNLIQSTIISFNRLGIKVLSPAVSGVVDPSKEFVILDNDDTCDPETLERRHLNAIAVADALYIVTPGGYMGCSAILEFGYALALNKHIFTSEKVGEMVLNLFCTVATPAQTQIV